MILNVGDIVTTSVGGIHKKVVYADRSSVRLEYYDETGIQYDNVGAHRCIFQSSTPTKEWNEMLEAEKRRVAACKKYHDEHEKPKRVANPNKKASGFINMNHGNGGAQ